MNNELIDYPVVKVTISDPWEFFDDNHGSSSFIASILNGNEFIVIFQSFEKVAVRMYRSLSEINCFLATPRHKMDDASKSLNKGYSCNIYPLPDNICSLNEADDFVRAYRSTWMIGHVILYYETVPPGEVSESSK